MKRYLARFCSLFRTTPSGGFKVNDRSKLGKTKGPAQAEAYFSYWKVCFVRYIQLCWARPSLIKVFCSTESHTGPEHAEAVLFSPSITSTVITFVYSGGNSSCLIRSYWGDNSKVIWKWRPASLLDADESFPVWSEGTMQGFHGERPWQITTGLSNLQTSFLQSPSMFSYDDGLAFFWGPRRTASSDLFS